jgi:DNA replication and repair protein RecF
MQKISEITLENFRNHQKVSIPIGELTVLVGDNGVGKTAILEALSLLSVADSWKTERDSEVVMWERDFCRVTSGDSEIVIQVKPSFKRYRIDGISKRLSDILGRLPTVLFQPEDSNLIHGSPSQRRLFLDRLLSQVVPGYAKNISHVQKVLKNRNKLLKQVQEGKAREEELTYWDNELKQCIGAIQPVRRELVTEILPIITTNFKDLLHENLELEVYYQNSPGNHHDFDDDFFIKQRSREIAAGVTLYGPHREDIEFMVEGRPADTCLSRGQTRALVLALKLAELHYIEGKSEKKPLLLLDDIFAEFDHSRRAKVLKLLQNYQTVMAVTDLIGLEEEIPKHATIVKLH